MLFFFFAATVNQLPLLIFLMGHKLVRRAIERELNGYTGCPWKWKGTLQGMTDNPENYRGILESTTTGSSTRPDTLKTEAVVAGLGEEEEESDGQLRSDSHLPSFPSSITGREQSRRPMKAELEPSIPLSDIAPFQVVFLVDQTKITNRSSLGKWLPQFCQLGLLQQISKTTTILTVGFVIVLPIQYPKDVHAYHTPIHKP